MRRYDFDQSNSNHTLFLKHLQGNVTTVIIYVDDMIIIGDDIEEISRLQEQLTTEFEMKNLGGLQVFFWGKRWQGHKKAFSCIKESRCLTY